MGKNNGKANLSKKLRIAKKLKIRIRIKKSTNGLH